MEPQGDETGSICDHPSVSMAKTHVRLSGRSGVRKSCQLTGQLSSFDSMTLNLALDLDRKEKLPEQVTYRYVSTRAITGSTSQQAEQPMK